MTTRSRRRGPKILSRWAVAVALLATMAFVAPAYGDDVAPASACSYPLPASVPQRAAEVATETTGLSLGVRETGIRWTRWHTRIVYGGTAQLAGQVVTEDGAVSDATVDLFARAVGSAEWSPVGSAATDPDTGVFTFTCLRPARSTDYRVVYDGTLLYSGSQAERRISVARSVFDGMKQVAPMVFRFRGSVAPRYVDRPVVLERKDCAKCRWRTVARKNTTSRSRWGFTIDSSALPGQRWFRAAVPADQGYLRSYSEHVWRLRSS